MFGWGKTGERRAVTRYEAIGNVSLGWREDSEFRAWDATLVDISQNGACFTAANAPRRGANAWMLIGDGTSEVWLRGKVVEVSRGWRGRYTIRVCLEEHFPYEFIRSSIRGLRLTDADPDSGPDAHRDDHLWR